MAHPDHNERSMTLFFDMTALMGRRTARQRERLSHTLHRLCEARNEAAVQDFSGGSVDTPAPVRAPRRTRTATRKPASGGDGDCDGDGPAPQFTISTSPTDGIIVGAATLCTGFMLMARYGGRPIVPIEIVCEDYFAKLTVPNLRRKISSGEIPLPLVRMESGSKKAAQGVHLSDLTEYIDTRRAAAVKERNLLCN